MSCGSTPSLTVFEVLREPKNYSQWVVGSREIRNAGESWPRSGSRFGHTVGMPPFKLRDDTEVLEIEPPRVAPPAEAAGRDPRPAGSRGMN